MKLLLTRLGEVLVDRDDVVSLRGSDGSGSFGILAGHADFLTALSVGVLSWKLASGEQQHCAVHGGVLKVRDGAVSVATREAVIDTDLQRLQDTVVAGFLARDESEARARTGGQKLELGAVRELIRLLNPGRGLLR